MIDDLIKPALTVAQTVRTTQNQPATHPARDARGGLDGRMRFGGGGIQRPSAHADKGWEALGEVREDRFGRTAILRA
jgi:hypothetical protein